MRGNCFMHSLLECRLHLKCVDDSAFKEQVVVRVEEEWPRLEVAHIRERARRINWNQFVGQLCWLFLVARCVFEHGRKHEAGKEPELLRTLFDSMKSIMAD